MKFEYDFCEECGGKFLSSDLSADGIRCGECDPEGIIREGTYRERVAWEEAQ